MRTFANVNVSTDTFFAWLTKTNQALAAFGQTLTVSSNTSGDNTTGNGFVTGILGANVLSANTIRGGNVQSSSNLNISGNVDFTTATITHNSITSTYANTYTTSNTSAQIVDSFAANTFSGGKYLIYTKNNTNLDTQMTEILVLQNGANAMVTEYATLTSNSSLGTYSANVDTGIVRLYFVPNNANTKVNITRTLMNI